MLLQTAMPLLAVQLGVNWMLLGTIGWIAQAFRTPICLASGSLSEKVGRKKIIIPSACLCALALVLLGRTTTYIQLIILYSLAMVMIGSFYPPLQARIADVSEQGQLRKNLGMFNIGWCVGGAVAGWTAGMLVGYGLSFLFYIGAGCCMLAAVLVFTWRGRPVVHATEDGSEPVGEDFGSLLTISRMGHFLGFFGYSTVRILFPKLAVDVFHWKQSTEALVVSLFLWGLGIGILMMNASPWWRGKLWAQIMAQCGMVVCALGVAFSRSPIVLGTLFFGFGIAQSIAYTGALYYGLSSRKGRGNNTGIHEALVAIGCVSGCLLGGMVAQHIAPVAPFVLLAGLAATALVITAVLAPKVKQPQPSPSP